MWVFLFWLGPEPVHARGLEELLALGLERAPERRAAAELLRSKSHEVSRERAKWFPSLDFVSTHGLQNFIPIGQQQGAIQGNPTAPFFSMLGLQVSETLYDNGVSWTRVTIAEKEEALAKVRLEQIEAQIKLRISEAWFDYSVAHALYSVRLLQYKLLMQQVGLIDGQYQEGLKPRVDAIRIRSQKLKGDLDLQNAKIEISRSLNQFRPWFDEDELEGLEPTVVPDDLAAWVRGLDIAEPSRPTYYASRIHELREELADQQVLLKTRELWPVVDVRGQGTFQAFNYLNARGPFEDRLRFNWSFLIGIRFNIFDFGMRRADEAAQIATRASILHDAYRVVLQDQTDGFKVGIELQRLKQEMQTRLEVLRLEQETHDNVSAQFREGKASFMDLISALNQLSEARVQIGQGFFKLRKEFAKFEYYEGPSS